ncbi:MAG: histone deacetylase [Candidatus Aenigmarchaeota archaeon]|nr:histone deacetylase [Candidatus Aenigmarchaeota archaeon]
MKIVFSPRCLQYYQPGHPEGPERIERTLEHLKQRGYLFSEPAPCREEELLLCHSQEHVDSVRSEALVGGETPVYSGIFDYARLAAGGALRAMLYALDGEDAFSLMRPPGHHASKGPEGFCYFNNIAIAVKKALEKVERVGILDFDAHHGNGTQDIFLGDSQVFYVSLHQAGIYPGTGLASEKNCINFPLAPFTGEEEYLRKFEKSLERMKQFMPDLLAVSAGFDAHREDPITQLGLTEAGFGTIGEKIKGFGVPVFAVMEGGYSEKVPKSVREFLRGLE